MEVYVHGEPARSKKQVREALAERPSDVVVVNRSFAGPITEAPDGRYEFQVTNPVSKKVVAGVLVKDASGLVVVR